MRILPEGIMSEAISETKEHAPGIWEAVSETKEHAHLRSKVHNFASGRNYAKHRNLGIAVTLLTAFVGGSVFSTLTENNPPFWLQVFTGVFSLGAALLAAAQTFYGYLDLAEKHKKAAIEFLSIQKRAQIFLTTFSATVQLSDAEKEKAVAEQASILEAFHKTSLDAPIRTDEDYAAVQGQQAPRRGERDALWFLVGVIVSVAVVMLLDGLAFHRAIRDLLMTWLYGQTRTGL
jgi:hypothetical protein